jgi:oxygen-independent coproporphyrinogen III oxidase
LLQPDPASRPRRIDGLYIHVPFCFHKCHYCDFYSLVDDRRTGDRQEAFVDRLVAELRFRAAQTMLSPQTLFIGGGTPTLLRPPLWRRLLDALAQANVLAGIADFTVEANPETVTAELTSLLAHGGVNRVSLGAQSFQPALLKTLERWHDPANVARAVETCRAAGIDNINLDLIFATPGQTIEMLAADLDAALALAPDHLSCYGLTYEPNTAMTQRLKLGHITPVPEEIERQMYTLVIARLDAAGFEHYEVSNWARREPDRDRRCRHNLVYWSNGNWLGLGPAAASHVDGHRWKNQAHLGRYLAAGDEPPIVDYEHLPPERNLGERMMLMLRLRSGAPLAWLESNLPATDQRWTDIQELLGLGMLERTATHLRLSDAGLFVADTVIARLL